MNKSIIYLGVLSVMFINTVTAKNVIRDHQNFKTEFSKVELNSNYSKVSNFNIHKPLVNLESELEIQKSIASISSNYKKSIEQTIEDNKKITQSQEITFQPLYLETSIEDVIRINNQIIESTISDDSAPLDFELINNTKLK